jgi:hypothetical protein
MHSSFLIEARNACIMLHFYNLATVALHQFIVPTDTSYLFERLGQLRNKSLCHCLDTFHQDDRLLKGNESTELFVAVFFAPNLPGNNNKKVKQSITIDYSITVVYNIIPVDDTVGPLVRINNI